MGQEEADVSAKKDAKPGGSGGKERAGWEVWVRTVFLYFSLWGDHVIREHQWRDLKPTQAVKS